MTQTTLIIPDAHAHPDYDNDRFVALGNYIVVTKPDLIICLGDMADMPSLCSYDKGKKSFEGRRYKADIEATIDAQEKLFKPLNEYNEKQRRNKEKLYKPKMVLTLGNHEDRITRAVNYQPELDGVISISDLQYEKFGWEVIPFLVPYIFEQVAFCHYFTSGLTGTPICGDRLATNLINKGHMSAVVGHSHIESHDVRPRFDGSHIFGLSAGCYSHPGQIEGWNMTAVRFWWYGVYTLEGLKDGYYRRCYGITQSELMQDFS